MATEAERQAEQDERDLGPVRTNRRLTALFADTREWIDKLESDAHWARTPDARRENEDKARILRDLLEEITR